MGRVAHESLASGIGVQVVPFLFPEGFRFDRFGGAGSVARNGAGGRQRQSSAPTLQELSRQDGLLADFAQDRFGGRADFRIEKKGGFQHFTSA